MRELIKTHINDIIRKIAPDFKGSFNVDATENKAHGDYSTNIAFVLSKALRSSSQEIAEKLANKLKIQKLADFSKIEATSGFINFFLSPDCLLHQVKEILSKKDKYGLSTPRQARSRKIQIEFISANPTGPLTIGNGRGGFLGDVLANVLASQGYQIEREYYINDRGEQILKLGQSIKIAQKSQIPAWPAGRSNLKILESKIYIKGNI